MKFVETKTEKQWLRFQKFAVLRMLQLGKFRFMTD